MGKITYSFDILLTLSYNFLVRLYLKGRIYMKALKSFFITLVIILAIGCLFIVARKSIMNGIAEKNVKTESAASEGSSKKSKANPVTKAIVGEAMDTYIKNSSNEKVQEIAESMSEEDKDTVTEIIANNVSLDAIPEVQSYISGGDKEGLMEYAKDNFSEEEIAELKDIMSKYTSD